MAGDLSKNVKNDTPPKKSWSMMCLSALDDAQSLQAEIYIARSRVNNMTLIMLILIDHRMVQIVTFGSLDFNIPHLRNDALAQLVTGLRSAQVYLEISLSTTIRTRSVYDVRFRIASILEIAVLWTAHPGNLQSLRLGHGFSQDSFYYYRLCVFHGIFWATDFWDADYIMGT